MFHCGANSSGRVTSYTGTIYTTANTTLPYTTITYLSDVSVSALAFNLSTTVRVSSATTYYLNVLLVFNTTINISNTGGNCLTATRIA